MAKYLDFHSKEERDFDDTALLELFRRPMREDRKVRRKVRLIPVPERLADIERCVRFLERLAMNIGLDPRECIRVEQRELQPTGVDITFAVPWFRVADMLAFTSAISAACMVSFSVENCEPALHVSFNGVFRKEYVE